MTVISAALFVLMNFVSMFISMSLRNDAAFYEYYVGEALSIVVFSGVAATIAWSLWGGRGETVSPES